LPEKSAIPKTNSAVLKNQKIFLFFLHIFVLWISKKQNMNTLLQKMALTFAFAGSCLLGKAQNNCKLDSSFDYNSINNITKKNHYLFGANNKLSEQVIKNLSNGNWNNSSKLSLAYTSSGKVTSQTQQLWLGNQWRNSSRYVYDFDANGNQLTNLSQYWDTTASSWKLFSFQQYYTYNSSNKKTLHIQVYVGNGVATDSTRQTYAYEANGNEISVLREGWSQSNPVWRNSQKWLNFHNTNNQKDSSYNLIWNVASTTFDIVYKHEYTYDAAGNQIESIFYQTSGNAWNPYFKYVDTYDVNSNKTFQGYYTWASGWLANNEQTISYNVKNKVTSGVYKAYDFATTALVNNYRCFYTYDAIDSLTLVTYDNWDKTSSTWLYETKYEYFNSCAGSVGITEPNKNKAISFFPNPTKNQIYFSTETNVELSNLSGQTITSKKNASTLDLSEQPTGIYFIVLTDHNGKVIQRNKIVKE